MDTKHFAASSRYNLLAKDKTPQRILIHGVRFCISADESGEIRVERDQSVLVEDGLISKVFAKEALHREVNMKELDLIYDAEQKGGVVLTPGFVNLHAHPPMYLLRATLTLNESSLEESLRGMARLEHAMTEEELYLGALGDLTEQQKSGITFTLSHYATFDPIDRAAREARHQVVNCISAASNSHPENTPELVESILKKSGTWTRAGASLHYPWKGSHETLEKVARLMCEYDCYFTAHVNETVETAQACVDKFGMTTFELLEKYGLLGPKSVLSHCVHQTPAELDLIEKRRPVIVHMPTSNLIHRSGVFDYAEFRKRGIAAQIGLGTDSVVSKNKLDLLSEALAAKTLHQLNEIISYAELFKMCTSQPAQLLGLNAGRIAPGMRADLAFWKLKDRGMIPFNEKQPETLISNLITHGSRDVRDLMIGGQFIISNRYHNLVNESRLLENLQEAHMAMQDKTCC